MSVLKTYKFHFYLLLLILVCYLPFTLFHNSLSNDNIDVALATKYFAGTCLQNGELPLWNPYQIFGFPAHADLQYTNWNIEVLIIGILKDYDYNTLHILYLLYLYIGALGMFLLSKFLSKNTLVSFYFACVYILSGLFTSHSQSLVTILGLVWMPYVLLYYLKWLENPSLKTSALVAVFSYLAFTLGYQAIAFMLIPIFVGLLAIKIHEAIKNTTIELIKRYVKQGFITLLFLAILLSPVLVTQIQSKPFVERLNGMSLEEVMANPFSPWGLVSLINPILTIGNDDLFNTEVTMRNIYIGIIPLILFVVALFKKNKTKLDYLFLSFGLLFILASFGDYTPIRKVLYYILPGFKLFRFPALIRLVAIICLLIFTISNFRHVISTFYQKKKSRNILLILFLGLSLTLTIVSFIKCETFTFFGLHDTFNQKIIKSSAYEIAFYYGLFQSILILTGLFLFNQAKSFRTFWLRIFIYTIIELGFTNMVYGQYVAYSNTKPKEIQENFAKLTSYFPEPSKDPQILNSIKFDYLNVFWKNTGCFKKQAMPYDEWTSYMFKNYNQLQDHFPKIKQELYSYPFIYFSKPLKNQKMIGEKIDTSRTLINDTFHPQNAICNYDYLSYDPHHIVLSYKNDEELMLNLQQTYYDGWTASIDGHKAPMYWNASLLMSLKIPAGEHLVEFNYTNPPFVKSLILSYSFLLILILLLTLQTKFSIPYKIILIILLASFVGKITFTFINHSKNRITSNRNMAFLNKENLLVSLNSRDDYRWFWDLCKKNKSEQFSYSWINYYNSPEFIHTLNSDPDKKAAKQLSGYVISRINDGTVTKNLFREIYNGSYPDKQFIDTLHNNYSLKLEGKYNPYSKAVIVDLTTLQEKNIYGFVKLRSDKGSNPHVSCAIKFKNGEEKQKYFALNKYLIPDGTLQSIPYYFDLSKINKDEIEEIKLFLMNQTEETIYVASFEGVRY